jgi:hypothetical protein
MLRLFRGVASQIVQPSRIDINEEEQEFEEDPSTDEEGERLTSYIINQIVEEYRLQAGEKFAANEKLKGLIEEFIDWLETDYFESALVDLLDASYQNVIKVFLTKTFT